MDARTFSFVRGDALFRLQQAVGLIPAEGGLGIVRRALLLAAVTWVPIIAWALATGRAVPPGVDEPLLQHFGVHARCLIAIPLLVVAEASTEATLSWLLPHFVSSGLVEEGERARFDEALRSFVRLRDRWLPWILLLAAVVAWTVARPLTSDIHELDWASNGGTHQTVATTGFGGWWFLNVARPIFSALLLAWIWRLALLWMLLRRIARLDLAIVPTHPDGVGGLGFLDHITAAFAPVVLAASTVASSRWAHDVVYHDTPLLELKLPVIAFAVVVAVLFLAPLLSFSKLLVRAKRRGLLEYGTLVGDHGRRVRRRWILGEHLDDDAMLAAPEIGPVADTAAIYDAVRRMRPVAIGPRALAGVIVPAILPILVVASLRVPVKDMLLGLVRVLL